MENTSPNQPKAPDIKPATTPSTPAKAVTPPKSSNTALIIIIVVVVGLVLLSVGGYFVWRLVAKSKTTTTSDKRTTITPKANQTSLQALEKLYTYPGGTLTETDRTGNLGSKSAMFFETTEKIQAPYDYYINLANQNKLSVTKKSFETDASSASLTLQSTDYYVEISFYQYDKAEFTVYIYGDSIINDTVNTGSTTTTVTPTGAAATPTPATTSTSSSNYLIADSNTRIISTTELTGFSPWNLKVARNEIYARHGRAFVHKDLQCYFQTKSWYHISSSYSSGDLSSIENKNVATIQAYEQATNSPLASHDSGCNTN